jgi:hypothetical protein
MSEVHYKGDTFSSSSSSNFFLLKIVYFFKGKYSVRKCLLERNAEYIFNGFKLKNYRLNNRDFNIDQNNCDYDCIIDCIM